MGWVVAGWDGIGWCGVRWNSVEWAECGGSDGKGGEDGKAGGIRKGTGRVSQEWSRRGQEGETDNTAARANFMHAPDVLKPTSVGLPGHFPLERGGHGVKQTAL